jgi:hypothetical protein
MKAPAAAREIELACDTMHINSSMLDIHGAFESAPAGSGAGALLPAAGKPGQGSFSWVLLNPVDLFRAMNLPAVTGVPVPPGLAFAGAIAWMAGLWGFSLWNFRSKDL